MSRPSGGKDWSLEVLRGRELGRRFPLPDREVVLGNAIGNGDGIDLSMQEGTSPRRMAGRQALVCPGLSGPVLRDLDSPGGTFVNRRRLLPGQDHPLKPGDVIQLGGIQLRVVSEPTTPGESSGGSRPSPHSARSPSPPGAEPLPNARLKPQAPPTRNRAPLAFPLRNGLVCRDWDDFLTVSSQRWKELREELTSGRLASYLVSIGRPELAPRADAPGSPDDRLDAWLGSLPTTRPTRPELDVHPRSIEIRTTPGARVRRTFRVGNVGFRILRSKVRVEPNDTNWISVEDSYAREFSTIDETEVTLEVSAPAPFPKRISSTVVIESNGGSDRVAVTLEPATVNTSEPPDGPGTITEGSVWSEAAWTFLKNRITQRSFRQRLLGGMFLGMGFRLTIGLACGLTGVATLPGPALLLALVGAVAGGIGLARRGAPSDILAGGVAGAVVGLIASAILVASCQAIDPVLGARLSRNLMAVTALWGGIGTAIGAGSLLTLPEGRGTDESHK